MQTKFNGFELVPNENGGYLVQVPESKEAFIAVCARHETDPKYWGWRPWDTKKKLTGKYPTLREAAQAAFDEREV
jgi:hypothetical protein